MSKICYQGHISCSKSSKRKTNSIGVFPGLFYIYPINFSPPDQVEQLLVLLMLRTTVNILLVFYDDYHQSFPTSPCSAPKLAFLTLSVSTRSDPVLLALNGVRIYRFSHLSIIFVVFFSWSQPNEGGTVHSSSNKPFEACRMWKHPTVYIFKLSLTRHLHSLCKLPFDRRQ